MFWSSVHGGLRLLHHPEIWVGALAVVAALVLSLVAVNILATRTGCALLGCLTVAVGAALLPAFLNAVYYAFVLPIVLGGASTTPSGVVGAHLGRVAHAGLVAAGVGILISLIPFFKGPFRSAFTSFAQGVIIARALIESPFRDAAGLPAVTVRFPGFGLLMGYLAVAVALSLVFGAPTWIRKLQKKRRKVVVQEGDGTEAGRKRRPPPSLLEIITSPLAIVAGYLPVFMYLQYLAATRAP